MNALKVLFFLLLEDFRRDIVLLTLNKRFKTDYQYIETLRVAQRKGNGNIGYEVSNSEIKNEIDLS